MLIAFLALTAANVTACEKAVHSRDKAAITRACVAEKEPGKLWDDKGLPQVCHTAMADGREVAQMLDLPKAMADGVVKRFDETVAKCRVGDAPAGDRGTSQRLGD